MMQKNYYLLENHLLKLICMFLLVVSFAPLSAQEMSLSGTVVDQGGAPMPGVNVVVKGKTINSVTDVNGKFSIKCLEGDVLSFTFIGYQPQEIPVSTNPLNITLQEEVQQLNEVVVIGYGVQKKSDLTGSVASVNAKDIQNMPVTRVDEALQGKAAGVQIFQNSGQPGSEPKIRVRGLATVNGGSPLVVIDGVTGGSISDLNPSDIESMEILKDAASQAIYGSAGGNGVILITTKRGKTNHFSANLDMYWGSQEPWSKDNVKVCNSQEYAKIYNQVKTNYFPYDASTGKYKNIDTVSDLVSTNWVDKIFRSSAMVQNYNVSVNGGTKKVNVYSSFGYSNEDGTLKKTNYQKYTARLNTDFQILKNIKIGESFNFSQNANSGQDERNEYNSPLSTALVMLPIVPVNAKDGSGNYAYRGSNLSSNTTNPLAQIEYNNNIAKNVSYFGNVFLKADIIKGLSFETHYAISNYTSKFRKYTPTFVIGDTANPSASQSRPINEYQKNDNSGSSWQWQDFFTYNLQISDIHEISAVAGFEVGGSEYEFTNRTEADVYMRNKNWEDFDSSLTVLADGKKPIKGYSYFGRINYNFANILLLQGNLRRDHSSKFGTNKRVGTFPAISAGFKFSELGIIKNLGVIDLGKIRVGYGETGNQDIQPFLYNSTIGSIPIMSYPFGGTVQDGSALLTAGNPDLSWETVVTKNIGVDLGLFKNKLSFSFDYFTRKNESMLLRQSVPYTAGYLVGSGAQTQELGDGTLDTRPMVNYGALDNSGFEISLSFKDKIGDLSYDIGGNLTHTVTKINDIGDPLYGGNGRGLANVCRTMNDQPVSVFWGYKTDGIYQESEFVWYKNATNLWKRIVPDNAGNTEVIGTDENGNSVTYHTKSALAKPGDLRFLDTNGDGVINTEDMTKIGDPNPLFTYGFNASLSYKWFDFNMFFQGSYGNDIFNMMKVNLYSSNNGGLNWSPNLKDGFVPAVYNVKVKTLPVLTSEAFNTNTGKPSAAGDLSSSDFYIEDGSYLRLKNIQLGYTLPNNISKKIRIEKMRVYIGAKNLLTFTNYSGLDPEVGENTGLSNSILERGFDRGTYPQSKMYLVGLNLTF